MIPSSAAGATAILAFALSGVMMIASIVYVFDRAWLSRLGAGGLVASRVAQARLARDGTAIAIGAVVVLSVTGTFVVPSIVDASPFSSVLGGATGAWAMGLTLLGAAVVCGALDLAMLIRIRRSLSRGLVDPRPNGLPGAIRWTAVGLCLLLGLVGIFAAGATGWLIRQ